jgi:hypothetical protein
MKVRNIPRAQWTAFLDQFSRSHRAWLATIDAGAPLADLRATVPHPLRSVTPHVHDDRVVHIDIRFQDGEHTQAPLRVTAPGTVRVDETTDGVAQTLEIIDSQGVATRLRLRAAPRAEMLNGIAAGELSI